MTLYIFTNISERELEGISFNVWIITRVGEIANNMLGWLHELVTKLLLYIYKSSDMGTFNWLPKGPYSKQ